MSADNYAGMTTERLLELFVAAAKRFGGGRRLFNMMNDMRASKPPGTPQQTPEQVKAADDVRALGAMLRKRVSIPQARRLMEDDDPDVRTCAAGQFGSMDQEWASSTWNALAAGRPTREVLADRARARRPPPAHPTLKEMSDDALLGRFEDAATRLSATRFLDCIDEPDDQEAKNRLICEGTDILCEVKARGLLDRLVPLLDSANDTVRFRAAQGCLRIAEPQAVAALEAIAAKKNFDDSIYASDTLDEWRNGKSLVDGL